MAGATPTSRSLAWCRKRGWPAQTVEYWLDLHKADGLAFAAFRALAVCWPAFANHDPEQAARRASLVELAEALKIAHPSMNRERWEAGPQGGAPGRRIDLWGCIDIMVLDGKPGYLGLQACRAADISTRIAKARAIPELGGHLRAGNRWWAMGWRQVKVATKAGGKVLRWRPRVVALTLHGGAWGTEEVEQANLVSARPPLAPPDVVEEQRENQPPVDRDDE